jgi:carbon-monoxide dehydrogenase large subunit
MSYMVERLVDQAAAELGDDPAELRRRNLVRRDAFPYRTANGTSYDCGDFEGCLDKALAAADWDGFAGRRMESSSRGTLRGRGIATYIEATGAGNVPGDQVELRFGPDAGITLHVVSHSQGQGHETSFAQVVGRILGTDPARVALRCCDPAVPLVGNSTGGSRTLVGVGSALALASRKVIDAGMPHAAEHLEAAAADLEFDSGTYRIKGTDRAVTLEALARKLARSSAEGPTHPLDVRAELRSGATFPNGCHIAEVEIDPQTGEAGIRSYVAVDDAGNLIHPQIVEGQMMGGLTQGAGQVFGERAIYDPETGQLLSGSFMDYPMPRAVLVGGLVLKDHPVPTASNLLGAKGIGEAGVTGALPALMNAVADALRSAGVPHFDLPATPLRVWQALNQPAH